MHTKLLKLGSALTVAAAFLNATTAPAAAGGYDYNAALINSYIQSAPWTSYGGHSYGHSYGSYGSYDAYGSHGWKSWDYAPYKSAHKSYGWAPYYDHYDWPDHDWHKSYVSSVGHGTVSYYDDYGGRVIYGAPAYAKRTTIVHPTVKYDHYDHYGHDDHYGHGGDMYHDAYADDHVMHVGKHATALRDPVFFAFGSATLSYEAKHELKQIGQIISAYYFDDPKVLILLSGFTDATGTSSANEALAKARNHAVKDFLIAEFGFDKSRFVLRAVGEDYANMSGMPYSDNQRKVVVSLVGLPKSVTDHGHRHHVPAESPEMTSSASPETTAPTALDKGEVAPAEDHAMATPAPAMKPMPKPAETAQMVEHHAGHMAGHMAGDTSGYMAEHMVEHMSPSYAPARVGYVKPVSRCYVPSGPFAGTYVDGKLVATLFTDIDDYGGGRLEEVCALSY